VTPAFGGQYSIQLSYGRFCRWGILQTIGGHRNVSGKETRAPEPSECGRIELAILPLQIRLDIFHDRFEFVSVPNRVKVMRE
jgi:hypothetical protein